MEISDRAWELMQKHLGYSNEEMEQFKQNPRNQEVIAKAPGLMGKTIVIEVIESHGCNSQHRVGDTFYLDGAGNLLTKLCPKRMCVYALNSIVPAVFATNELYYAGVDPNRLAFRRAGCSDVGLQCGGWGHIVMELRVEDRDKVAQKIKEASQ